MDLDELARAAYEGKQKAAYERLGADMAEFHYQWAWDSLSSIVKSDWRSAAAALVNEVLEEAAKTCDPTEEPHDYRYDPMAVYEALQGCAAKIRSLKLK